MLKQAIGLVDRKEAEKIICINLQKSFLIVSWDLISSNQKKYLDETKVRWAQKPFGNYFNYFLKKIF